jgi:hypothetical protein
MKFRLGSFIRFWRSDVIGTTFSKSTLASGLRTIAMNE